MKKPATTTKAPTLCLCGCGDPTKGGRFLPGHDARLKYTLIATALKPSGGKRAEKQLDDLGWTSHLEAARERQARQTKNGAAKPAAVAAPVKAAKAPKALSAAEKAVRAVTGKPSPRRAPRAKATAPAPEPALAETSAS